MYCNHLEIVVSSTTMTFGTYWTVSFCVVYFYEEYMCHALASSVSRFALIFSKRFRSVSFSSAEKFL